MEPALPLKSVVLFIACGTMVAIIVFIFAKRQITRFALKSRGPHVTIGSDAPKDLRQEIERRLHRVGDICFEPVLLPVELQSCLPDDADQCHFFYRMRAVDALAILDEELLNYSPNIRRRLGQYTLRSFLLELRQSGPLDGCKIELIEKFTEAYSHARHDPIEFMEPQYQDFMRLLNQLLEHIRKQRDKKLAKMRPSVLDNDKVEVKQTACSAAQVAPALIKTDILAAEICPAPTEDISVTYRPRGVDRTAGVLEMTPARSSTTASSQVDAGSLETQSVPSSARSSRGSGHFETPV